MRRAVVSAITLGLASTVAAPAAAGATPSVLSATQVTAPLSEAADAADAADDASSGWHFVATPYLWVAGVSGDVELAPGEEVDVDTKFTDILSALKFAAMGGFEARRARFVVLGDIIYLSMGIKSDGPRDTSFISSKVDTKIFIGTLTAGYRVVDKGPLFLDLFAGGRLSSLDVDVRLDGPLETRERDKSRSSLAPVFGGRFRAPLDDRWGLGVYGDVGGFGASAAMTWQLMGTVQYDLSDRWRASAGYRHVSIQHDKGDFDADLGMSGPIIGFSYRF